MEKHIQLTENLKDLHYGNNGVGKLGYIYYGGVMDLTSASDIELVNMSMTSEEEHEEVEHNL